MKTRSRPLARRRAGPLLLGVLLALAFGTGGLRFAGTHETLDNLTVLT